jgi:hypothetical protein
MCHTEIKNMDVPTWQLRVQKGVLTIVILAMFFAVAGAYQRLAAWRDLPAHRAVHAPQIMLSILGESLFDFSNLQIMQLNDVPIRMYTGTGASTKLAYEQALDRLLREGWEAVPLEVNVEETALDAGGMAILQREDVYALLLLRDETGEGAGVFLHAEIHQDAVASFEGAMEASADDTILGFAQDAPGKDIEGLPRPKDSIRMFNLSWSRGVLNAYFSSHTAKGITDTLAQEMLREDWTPVLPDLVQDDFLWYRKPGAEALIWCNPMPEQNQTMVMILAGYEKEPN